MKRSAVFFMIAIFLVAGPPTAVGAPIKLTASVSKGNDIGISQRGIEADLRVDPDGYVLRLELHYPAQVALARVVADLRNPKFQSAINEHVKQVQQVAIPPHSYRQTMVISALGVDSEFVADCLVEEGRHLWRRNCKLQMDVGDSSRYMEWKTDETICRDISSGVVCDVKAEGKLKPVRFLGLTVMGYNAVTMQAKSSAIGNFTKLWLYSTLGNVGIDESLKRFTKLGLEKKIADFIGRGEAALDENSSFTGHLVLTE